MLGTSKPFVVSGFVLHKRYIGGMLVTETLRSTSSGVFSNEILEPVSNPMCEGTHRDMVTIGGPIVYKN